MKEQVLLGIKDTSQEFSCKYYEYNIMVRKPPRQFVVWSKRPENKAFLVEVERYHKECDDAYAAVMDARKKNYVLREEEKKKKGVEPQIIQ